MLKYSEKPQHACSYIEELNGFNAMILTTNTGPTKQNCLVVSQERGVTCTVGVGAPRFVVFTHVRKKYERPRKVDIVLFLPMARTQNKNERPSRAIHTLP
jgi:hypothetical protein